MSSYKLAHTDSEFRVQAFATGLLSVFAHSPTFAARDFKGVFKVDEGDPGHMSLDLEVRADSLALLDRVPLADRRDIEERMRNETLEVSAYPEIRYQAQDISFSPDGPGRYHLRINGRLSLHGVTRDHPMEAELRLCNDGLRLLGRSTLLMSDYHIKPVTAVGGTIRLKNELRISVELLGLPEQS
ncbi:MAG: YceI family protein [Isosphaeraceae bacterium]